MKFTFPELNNTESEVVACIDNNEPLYTFVTDRAEELCASCGYTYEERMQTVERFARDLSSSVLPTVAGSLHGTLRADLIAEYYLAIASKDAEYRDTIL